MFYSIAQFPFRVVLPADMDSDTLLPSFRPFRIEEADTPLFTLTVVKGDGLRVTGDGAACGRINEECLTMNENMPNGPLTAHRSPLPHHPSPVTHHPSPFTLHPSPITRHPSPITHHPSPVTRHPSPLIPATGRPPLLEDENDMGRLRLYDHPEGYLLTLSYREDGPEHILLTDKEFTAPTAYVWKDDPDISMVLTSMLRIVYSQAVIPHGAISLHASVVTHEGAGYLFMGVSGTGKSTHSRLWMEHIPGCQLLNDDNPIVRLMEDGRAYVFGSPWSGKTPCYRAVHVPIGGIVRLQQAKVNRFVEQNMVEAFSQVLPGCSVVRADARLYNALCDTLVLLCTLVHIGRMECLPDREAALQCLEGLKKVNQ